MSKERTNPERFCVVQGKYVAMLSEATLSEEQKQELDSLYGGMTEAYQEGKLVKGTIVSMDNDGILVDIHYKSRGLIPRYEFNAVDLKKLKTGDEIEVLIESGYNEKILFFYNIINNCL